MVYDDRNMFAEFKNSRDQIGAYIYVKSCLKNTIFRCTSTAKPWEFLLLIQFSYARSSFWVSYSTMEPEEPHARLDQYVGMELGRKE